MDKRRLEAQVLRYVDDIVEGQRIEGSFVECKTKLSEENIQKAARQIAALANAARGERALWIVGLDEDGGTVVRDQGPDPSTWWPQVKKRFAELAPEMTSMRVTTDLGTVTVLEFETDRSPYLVNTTCGGGVDREVPWRDGTTTRTATRAQLLSILVENATVPSLELINPRVTADENTVSEEPGGTGGNLWFTAELFISATTRAMLPKHRWTLSITCPEWDNSSTPLPSAELRAERLAPLTKRMIGSNAESFTATDPEYAHGVWVTPSGLHVEGSGAVRLIGECSLDYYHYQTVVESDRLEVHVDMPVDRMDRSASERQKLTVAPLSEHSDHNSSKEWRSTN